MRKILLGLALCAAAPFAASAAELSYTNIEAGDARAEILDESGDGFYAKGSAAFGNNFWSVNLTQPIAAMPLQIFAYAISPYDDWRRLAWAGSLILILLVFVISLVARFATRSRVGPGHGD